MMNNSVGFALAPDQTQSTKYPPISAAGITGIETEKSMTYPASPKLPPSMTNGRASV